MTPLYIDPVHDFGFFKYSPGQIKHIKPHEFVLNPSGAQVGLEVRCIGNDAGQKIGILDGTLSRLDRNAPNYGKGQYNDFNTFYFQATTDTSGGSSGAPVINNKGEVIALNTAARKKSSTAYYLPLDRAKKALVHLQEGTKITRGTIQTTFRLTTYPELKRLGLNDEMEERYRQIDPTSNGMLVVKSIIPDSPASETLEIGDVLLSINEKPTINFLNLESELNKNVNQPLQLEVLRRGLSLSFQVEVSDLESISPKSYLKFDDSVFHNISYQQARHFNRKVEGVYVARSAAAFSRAGIDQQSLITQFNGDKVNDINDFMQQISKVEDGEKAHIRYFKLKDPKMANYAFVEINRKWFDQQYCQKGENGSHWSCENLPAPSTKNRKNKNQLNGTKTISTENKRNGKIEDALVKVHFTSPYSIQGRNKGNSRIGTGLIVDTKKGWVVVDRGAVISALGDVKLVFKNRLEVAGNIEYVHPLHNLVLISYPTEMVSGVELSAAPISKLPVAIGDSVTQVGLNSDGEIEYRQTKVDSTQELLLREFGVPKYVDRNLDAIHLLEPNYELEGVVVNLDNEVSALWALFEESGENGKGTAWQAAGIPAEFISELIELANDGSSIYTLDVGMGYIAPYRALQMGLTEEWLDKIMQIDPRNQKLLYVYDISGSAVEAEQLERGDLILAINDVPVSSVRQVELLTRQEKVQVTYLREGKVYSENIGTSLLEGRDIDRVLFWSGMYLHAPHRAAQQQRNVKPEGVYIASYKYGSPAARYIIGAMCRIVEVDDNPVLNLDEFILAVKGKQHKESVVLKTIDINNVPRVSTLKLDSNYWPFYEIQYRGGQWEKIDHNL